MRLLIGLTAFVSFGLLLSTGAQAFPELTRHGYASCTACHVSPNGGGALTPYGRNLSREVMSTFGNPREAEVGHGFLPKLWADELEKSKLRLGGDARWVQTHKEDSASRRGEFFLMQTQLEAGWDEGSWAALIGFGKIEDPKGAKEFRAVSAKYYGLVRFAENGSLRAGRFPTAYGLNFADHTISIKRNLGLGPEVDRDNLELSWLGEFNQYFATISDTAPGTGTPDTERSLSLRYDRIINERSRVGASVWRGSGGSRDDDSRFERTIGGVHSIVNVSQELFVHVEIDHQERINKRAAGDGLVNSNGALLRLNYEPVRGAVPFIQLQHWRGDFERDSSQADRYGLGFNLFPRPHFEIYGIWNRLCQRSEWSDDAYLMLHYFL